MRLVQPKYLFRRLLSKRGDGERTLKFFLAPTRLPKLIASIQQSKHI